MRDKREPGPTGARPQGLLQAYDDWSLVRVGGAGVVLAAGCAGVYAWLGSPPDALLALAAAGGALATVVAWRLTGGRRLVLHLGVGAMTALFGGAAVFGSIAYVAWLGLVSLVAFMLLGQRGGLLWTAAILALVAAAVVHLSAGGDQLSQGSVPVRMLRVIALVPTLAAVASFYERQRRQGLAELERAMAARSRLLAHVSHEMRTPLNGVIGLTQALLLAQPPEALVDSLRTIQHSGETLLALINDLLDVARAEAGTVEFAAHPFDLVRLVELTAALHQPRAQEAGVTLRLDLPAAPVAVAGDAVRVQQVLSNLMANAIRHGGRGQVDVTLRAEPGPGTTRLALSVRDRGPGLDPAQQQRLFQPFVQLDSRTAPGGSGLGLFISRSLARGLGGELELESAPGKGSTFTLRLALPPAVLTAPAEASPPRTLAGQVLVVDDNAVNLKVAGALLGKLGLTVALVESGERALEELAGRPPDLVLMDLQMPGMDGFEATRQLRDRGYRGPVVALTASAGAETAEECRRAGLNGCLVKPLRLAQLGSALERFLP